MIANDPNDLDTGHPHHHTRRRRVPRLRCEPKRPRGCAQRLSPSMPAHYRAYDREQGLPLLALMRSGEQGSEPSDADIDDLLDNLFIETCDDWVVPYLLGARGQRTSSVSRWEPATGSTCATPSPGVRAKGTPAMLGRDGRSCISGWPARLVEFFQAIGWSQHLDHLRLDHPLTAGLRGSDRLSCSWAGPDDLLRARRRHPAGGQRRPAAADVQPPLACDNSAWGTPGRFQDEDARAVREPAGDVPDPGGHAGRVDPGAGRRYAGARTGA